MSVIHSRFQTLRLIASTLAMAWPLPSAFAQATLSPQDCITETLAKNPDLAALQAHVAQTDADASSADAERRPLLSLGATSQHNTAPVRIRPITANNQAGTFSEHLWRADLALEWTLNSGGRLSAAQTARNLLAEAAHADLHFFQQRLATRVAQFYFKLSAQDALVASIEKSLESLRQQETRIGQLLAEGKAAEVDRMRVQVQAAGVQQRLIESRNLRSTLHATLNLLMDRPLDDPWQPEPVLEKHSAAPPLVEADLPASVTDRGDLEAAHLRESATARRIDEAKAARRPQVKALAAWGPRGDWEGRENYETGFIGLSANWSLWDGGRAKARLLAALQENAAATAQERSLQNQRQLEIDNAQRDLRAALESLDVSRLARSTASESLRIERRKYEQGSGAIVDVLDAEAASLESESLYRRAQANLLTSQVALDLALGRVFTAQATCTCLRQTNN
ncbi:outer membrane efflux protein [Verrucomicrobiia bacterium DG1235]|nr:outer membrane efflux protein [Verrucomicrobiae bacterium DG1235]